MSRVTYSEPGLPIFFHPKLGRKLIIFSLGCKNNILIKKRRVSPKEVIFYSIFLGTYAEEDPTDNKEDVTKQLLQ